LGAETVAWDFDKGRRFKYPERVRILSLARILFALLAFQLAGGLQVGVAHAAMPMMASAQMPAHADVNAANVSATAGDACPMHTPGSRGPSSHDEAAQAASLHAAPPAKAPQGNPADKHDCCKSGGCQGHCGSVPLAFNASLTRNSPVSKRVQLVDIDRAVAAPADSHFRPPIVA
jgi:hypothetical protein